MGRFVQGKYQKSLLPLVIFTRPTLQQICVEVTRNTLVNSGDRGKLLLRCIRAYVELDVLSSFEVHTEKTIEFGRKLAGRFIRLANVRHPKFIFYAIITNVFVIH